MYKPIVLLQNQEVRDCFHFNPSDYPEPNTEKKMCKLAKQHRRYDVKWGVVHPGHALCAGIYNTKRDAEEYRKHYAKIYVVVKVVITPLYTQSRRQ